MDKQRYDRYLQILKDELVPATGCTEPIALAYAAALGRSLLGKTPESVRASISGSIIKNVKSVVVPGTNGMKGIETAIAAGILVGRAEAKLEVLAQAPDDTAERIRAYLATEPVEILLSNTSCIFDIDLTLRAGADEAEVRITGHHTNVVLLRLNQEIKLCRELPDDDDTSRSVTALNIQEILTFVRELSPEDVAPVLERQIACNTALSDAGLNEAWGAQIGRTLLERSDAPDTLTRAKARAAAGSDARMSGCELPAVINSGSGNQGMTVTLPVVTWAEELHASHEELLRALALANLVAIRIKQTIGCLSAYCGAVCAGCAAGAGVAYLYGGDQSLIEHTVVNGLAILSGTICDGAKPSCAAKIAMSVEAGILGLQMARKGLEFVHGEGIVKKGIENTIEEVGVLGRDGMAHTNDVILGIMLAK